ncbi:DNA mismatch repair protein MutS [Megalodesulfovibrio paquesii]
MFEQYLSIKEQYPDALLFYRMGDFYELFFEDAETAARELSITLTSRNPNEASRIPMAGVPHHSARDYLARLLEKGYKVAICDQIEDPRQAKGLVKRAVTRVLTPATVLDDESLDAKEQTFLAALFWNDRTDTGALAWAEFSTGEWSGFESRKEQELWQWVHKLAPRELLVQDGQGSQSGQAPHREMKAFLDEGITLAPVPAKAYFDHASATQRLFRAQNVTDLAVLDLADKPELTRCLGAILTYLEHTQLQEATHLAPFAPLDHSRHLLVDEVTERNLELFVRLDGKKGPGSLWQAIDRTITPMGGRLLRQRMRQPWREMGPIQETQAMVAFFHDQDGLRLETAQALKAVGDLERLSTRVCLGRAMPRDMAGLRQSLSGLPHLRGLLAAAEPPPALARLLDRWDDLGDCFDLLQRSLTDSPPPTITDGGLIRPDYSPELAELAELADHGEEKLKQLLNSEQAAHNLPRLKMGYNRVFGHYFELPAAASKQAPAHWERRQTLANCERFVTAELKALEQKLLSATEQRNALEHQIFLEIRDRIAEARPRLLFMADALAGIDYWQALAETARRWDWTRPSLHEGPAIRIVAGRHPVVEAVQGASSFIPNDLDLDDDRRILLITGPNMAGKSTVLRQTALIVLLAQMGGFVPAREARIGLVDRVFSRVGASDNLAQGRSTFMVEMTETARILRQATKRSLVILDEIGRGTATFDGLALAWAVVEDLARRQGGLRTLFATHYHELTSLEGRIPGVRNCNIAVKEYGGEIIFLRRLVPGPADKSYGVEVARLAGVPPRVVHRARELLQVLEKQGGEGRARFAEQMACPTMLPGMTPPSLPQQQTPPPVSPEALELRKALQGLDVEHLTPVQALTLLHDWKQRWGRKSPRRT